MTGIATALTQWSWLPSGNLLAYEAAGSIIVRDNDGNQVGKIDNAGAPAISPDGKRLAFARGESVKSPDGVTYQYDIWTCNINGKKARRLMRTTDNETSPAWSPDGETIAFATRRQNEYGNGYGILELIKPSGDERHAITTDSGARRPSWSPDGTRLCFILRGGVCLVDATGKNRKRLTDSSTDDYPVFSPDGNWVAFSRGEDEDVVSREGGRDGKVIRATDAIYKIETERPERTGRLARRVSDGLGDSDCPTWSPDGQWIAFSSDRIARSKDKHPDPYAETLHYDSLLYRMRSDGTDTKSLSNGAADQEHPCWK